MDSDHLITQPDDLRRLVKTLKKHSRIAFDTESDSLYHYREKVCLVQVAAGDDVWLIDPLALKDLSALSPLFQSARTEKLFHGADYDIACLKRDFGFEFRNLFDTMIAAQLLGRKGWGLATLVETALDVKLQKGSQRANWSVRPLPPKMSAYAQEDVRHLSALRDCLAQELEREGRLGWLREECDVLCAREPAQHNHKTDGFLRIKGAGALPPAELAVLRAVHRVRERWAKKLDRPPFKVVGNGALLDMAHHLPRTMAALLKIRGVTQRVTDRCGEDLLKAIQAARAQPEAKWPRQPRPKQRPRAPGMLERIDRLRAWRKQEAARQNMDEGVLLSQNLIKALAASAPKDETGLRAVDGLRAWRVQEFGNELLDALWPANGNRKPDGGVRGEGESAEC